MSAGLLFAGGPAYAQALRREVAISVAGEPKEVEPVLRERVTGLKLEASFEGVRRIESRDVLAQKDEHETVLARIWVDLTDAENVMLYVVDEANDRVLVRKIRRNQNPEVTREEIGHIVERTLEALSAGQLIGITREAAREEMLPPPPREPISDPAMPMPVERPSPLPELPPRRWRTSAAIGYIPVLPGGGVGLVHGLGVIAGLSRWDGATGYGALLDAEYRFPADTENASTSVRLEGGAITALAVVATRSPRGNAVELALGGGAELMHVGAGANANPAVRFTARTDVVPMARALVRYRHKTPVIGAFVGIGVDLLIADKRYFLQRGNEEIVLFDPWRARPLFMIGVETP